MRDDEIWQHIDDQRADLADLLDTLSPEQWRTPSLCREWTVRDVAVHLTHANIGWGRMAWEALRSGFRFNAMMVRVAREDPRTPEEIVSALRAMVGQRRKPPGTSAVDPLMDTLIHGQDIARPLGIDRPMPTEAALVVAEHLWRMTFPLNPRRRFPGIAFTATDAAFAAGTGTSVTGPLADVLLVLAGRSAGLAGLTGDTSALALTAD
jgi:uncharacterized protein (TIGR03083 family)